MELEQPLRCILPNLVPMFVWWGEMQISMG